MNLMEIFMPPQSDSAIVRGIYHWLTPLLILALSTLIYGLGTSIIRQQSQQNAALTRLEIQVGAMQVQLSDAQTSYATTEAQIASLLQTQANHEHRITVLEQERINRGQQ